MNRIVIHADRDGKRIPRSIYGHFAEHLGRGIYDGVWVGEGSSIPNTRGMRDDVVGALRRINVPVLRWPGGCFADEYHWRDGVGPRAQRPVTINTHWGGVTESNAFGTHEFFEFAGLIGAEPYICGNVGGGTVHEMQQWVEYMTADGESAMPRWRRENGREEPWTVPYFGVGNENWGCGGNMRPEFYADQYRRYQTYVRDFGGKHVSRIACGANGPDYHWTEVLMREAASCMDGLSLHYYTVPGPSWRAKGAATGFDEEEWFTTLHKALFMDDLIRQHAAIMDRYDPEKRVAMVVDEWGTWYDVEPGTNPAFLCQQNTLRDALVAGLTLNIFNTHCDRVRMANLAQTVNVLQALLFTEGATMITTPTYHVFDLYQVHQDATSLSCTIQSDDYAHGEHRIRQIHASASRDAGRRTHLTVCNLDPQRSAAVRIEVQGATVLGSDGTVLTADVMDAHNTFQEPDRVAPAPLAEVRVVGEELETTLPPMSVVLLDIAAG